MAEVTESTTLTAREEKRQARERAVAQREAREKQLKADYRKIKDEPAFVDLVAKIRSFAEYHTKIAKDGVGFENKVIGQHEGAPIQEQVVVKLTHEQRVTDLDKAAGIEEILDYVTRKVTIDLSNNEQEPTDGNEKNDNGSSQDGRLEGAGLVGEAEPGAARSDGGGERQP